MAKEEIWRVIRAGTETGAVDVAAWLRVSNSLESAARRIKI